jgi:hypothetical protein
VRLLLLNLDMHSANHKHALLQLSITHKHTSCHMHALGRLITLLVTSM